MELVGEDEVDVEEEELEDEGTEDVDELEDDVVVEEEGAGPELKR